MVGRIGLAVAVTALALGACGPGEENSVVPSPSASAGHSASAGASSPTSPASTSPSELPTITQPTAPPSLPTDLLPNGLLAGRVTTLTDTCIDVTTDDGVVWSLVGDTSVELAVGDTVTARVTELDSDDVACGSGRPAHLVSIRVVGE